MSPERAWALAPRLIAEGLVPDPSEYNRLRTIVALSLLNYEVPAPASAPGGNLREEATE